MSSMDPHLESRALQGLNDRQLEAASTIDGPLIVLAGAGSGKTKMLTARISHIVESGAARPWEVLAVTFTNKAAAEMRERVERLLGLESSAESRFRGGQSIAGHPEVGTFHSVCVRLLRREMEHLPFTKPFVIHDDSDQLSLIKSTVAKLNIDEKAFNPKAFQGAINRLKCDATEPESLDPPQHNLFERNLKRVYEQYQKDLVNSNALDFGEILTATYRLLRDNEKVRAKYQKRYRYIHVDEYQDTNRAQYLLLQQLASPEFGGHANLCVVGDEDQSIYKWRGADIRNILEFEKDYPSAKTVKLEQNYRSTKTIITAASDVIRNNTQRKDKRLWTDNEQGLPIQRLQLADERGEAEAAIAEIKRLAGHEGRAYGDFAIFYRTNAQSRSFEDVLRRDKIPYQIVGGLRFYDRKEIKDVLAYFKAILNPADGVSLKRIINTPARGIGKTTLEKVDELQRHRESLGEVDVSWWAALGGAARETGSVSGATARKLQTFVNLMEKFMEAQPKQLLSELYHLILDEIGYVRELKQEGTEEALARIDNLEELDTVLLEFEEERLRGVPEAELPARKAELLAGFLEQSTLSSDGDKLDPGASTVKMMTLHSSKGLEFPVVFLAGMEEGLFPSIRPWEETPEEDIEEERRLCYVGMTRAREQLYMLHVAVRRFWGNVTYQEPSRFFDEIPAEHIQYKDMTSARTGFGYQKPRYGSPSSPAASSQGAPMYSRNRDRDGFDQSNHQDDDGPSAKVIQFPSQPRPLGQTGNPAADEWVGRKVDHPEYGLGTILSVEGASQDLRAIIEFAGRDRRKFLLRYVQGYVR